MNVQYNHTRQNFACARRTVVAFLVAFRRGPLAVARQIFLPGQRAYGDPESGSVATGGLSRHPSGEDWAQSAGALQSTGMHVCVQFSPRAQCQVRVQLHAFLQAVARCKWLVPACEQGRPQISADTTHACGIGE